MSFPIGQVRISIGDKFLNADSEGSVLVGETPGIWEIDFEERDPLDPDSKCIISYLGPTSLNLELPCLSIFNQLELDGSFNIIVESRITPAIMCQRFTLQDRTITGTPPDYQARIQSVEDSGFSTTQQITLNVAAAANSSSPNQLWRFVSVTK